MNTFSRDGLRGSTGAAWERSATLPSEQRCAPPLLSAPLVLSQSLTPQLKARLITPDSEEAKKYNLPRYSVTNSRGDFTT